VARQVECDGVQAKRLLISLITAGILAIPTAAQAGGPARSARSSPPYDGENMVGTAGADRFRVVNNDVTVDTKGATDAGRWREGRRSPFPPTDRRTRRHFPPGDVALGQVVRDLDTCPGPARRFSRTHPEAHVGR
jgi:hypothetical protein